MEMVVLAVVFTLLFYIPIQLFKNHINNPKKKGGFPYSRNKGNY